MDGWSVLLLATSGLLAVTGLARLMKHRHDALVARIRAEWRQEQDRQAAEERRRWREERERRLRQQWEQQQKDSPDQAA